MEAFLNLSVDLMLIKIFVFKIGLSYFLQTFFDPLLIFRAIVYSIFGGYWIDEAIDS
jgi:hypothetical protein